MKNIYIRNNTIYIDYYKERSKIEKKEKKKIKKNAKKEGLSQDV